MAAGCQVGKWQGGSGGGGRHGLWQREGVDAGAGLGISGGGWLAAEGVRHVKAAAEQGGGPPFLHRAEGCSCLLGLQMN